jgi:phage replication-related protein YjqB (UPF0714/DUF867 family)
MSSYRNFKTSLENRPGIDYNIIVSDLGSPLAVLAPHGGGIEPGTAEIAEALAGEQRSCYIFDGLSEDGNQELHLPSTHFDEPLCLKLVSQVQTVLTVHGCADKHEVVYIGGRNVELKQHLTQVFNQAGFDAQLDGSYHSGSSRMNICNKGTLGQGIQLEISSGLRRRMFKGLSREARAETTPVFARFISAVQAAINEY